METKKRTRTDSAQRIYKLLHRNPGLTTNEIMQHMPDLSTGSVQVAVSRMHQRGEIERRGKKPEIGQTGRVTHHYTYHVKYNSRSKPKPRIKRKQPAPKVNKRLAESIAQLDAPKVVETQPVWNPSGAKPEPTTPVAEREVLVLRHLTDIYKALNLMTEQQDALIQVLKGTLADLAETKDELEAARKARSFWGTVKGWFE